MAQDYSFSGDQVVEDDKTLTPAFGIELVSMAKQVGREKYTTAQITDASSACNSRRFEGKEIWNTTTSRPLWSAGDGRTDVWVDGQVTTVHTPS